MAPMIPRTAGGLGRPTQRFLGQKAHETLKNDSSRPISDLMKQLRLFVEKDLTTVLVADSDDTVFETMRRRVRRHAPREYRFVQAVTTEEALAAIAEADVDLVVVGVHADDLGGLERLRRLRSASVDLPVVVVHHGGGHVATLDAVVTGAQDVLALEEVTGGGLHRSFRNALARKRAEMEALESAYKDPVTGLGSRTWMLQRLERAVEHADEPGEWQVALLFIDLDRFKLVNDTLGHAAGDELLRMVAERLRAVVRADDPVARFGGDEFVILVEGHRIGELAHRIARRALAAFSDPFVIEGQPFSVFGSIGLAIRSGSETAETLLDHADAALYRAKHRGRNRVVVFDDEVRDWTCARQDLGDAVGAAVQQGSFDLDVAEVWDLGILRRAGHRVTASWTPPEDTRRLLLRSDADSHGIVALAERNGLGPDLGRQLLDRVLDLAAQESLEVALPGRWWVELPAGLLPQTSFPAWFAGRCHHHGVDPSRIALTFGEPELSDSDAVTDQIERLSDLGAAIALRDFGLGRSSLTLFSTANIDEVHLAPALCRGVAGHGARMAVVDGLVRIADAVGQMIVAEGGLTADDLDAVQLVGCHFAVTAEGVEPGIHTLDLADLPAADPLEVAASPDVFVAVGDHPVR
jgi:diguanylate cyclase (GGDEF)-like protein